MTLQVSENRGEQWLLFHSDLAELTDPEVRSFVDLMDMIVVVVTADA